MTIAAETNKVIYNCDGSKTEFDFTFKVFQTSDIKVILITVATGAETVLTETTHYAVTGSLSSGGKVTTVETYSSLYKLLITIDIDLDQETDLVYGGSYSSEAIETMADKLTKVAQQHDEEISRTIKFQIHSSESDIEIEDLAAGKTIIVNSAGDGLEMGESGGGLDNIVEDKTPQLGGNLDMNGKSIGGNTEAQLDDAISKKHAAGSDTALGAQAENLDMNTHKIIGVVDPTSDQEAATKKYVDDNAGGGGLSNVVEDLTPQLGGNLDMNGKSIGGNTETQLDDAVAKKHTQLCEAADFTKLDGIETGATKYPDTGEQAFLDADHTKLNGIETGATTDQTKADIDGLGLSHDSLVDVSANDHHAQSHNATSHSDIASTGANIDDAVTKKHTANGDTDLDSTFEATFVKKADTVNVLSDITSTGTNIEDAVTKKHAANADTALGSQSENLNMNTHKIVGVIDPTTNQEVATKKYVDDHSGGGLDNIVEDTTPQLGGNLDMNGKSIGGNTETQLDDAVAKKHAATLIGTKTIDETDIGNAKVIAYNSLSGYLEYETAGGGGVGTSGTPVDNDFAKFTDADTIEGRSYSEVRTDLNIEDGANVTDTANVTSAGALMDSEVDADIKTLVLPANTTISTAGKALIDDATASAQRTTLGLGSAATRDAEDSMTDGANLPDGHAIKTYGDSNWGGGSSGYDYIVTTKTAAGINTAIHSAYVAGGGAVLLSSGEYDCTGATCITMKDNVTLSGYGARLKSDGGLSNIIYATGLDNAKILGLEIDGQSPTYQGSTGENGILVSIGDNVTIKDCYIHGMQGKGIHAETLTNSLITNNHIVACYMGIRVSSPASKLIITENLIEDTYAGGITFSCAYNGTITDIVIANNTVDQSAVGETLLAQNIVCYSAHSGATSGTIRGITVTGNVIIGKGANHAGIRMGGDQITITGNKLYNTLDGILIRKTNNTAALSPSTYITISGNTLKNAINEGINVERGEHVAISNNTIDFTNHGAMDSGISVGANYGSAIYDNDDISITGNVICGAAGAEYGIYCNNTDRLMVTGNIIHTVSRDGIRFTDCTYANCQSNVVYDAGNGSIGYGVYLTASGSNASDYIVVANNQLNGNPDGAVINSSGGAHIKVYNNHGNNDFHT